jgi:hypothetical protein
MVGPLQPLPTGQAQKVCPFAGGVLLKDESHLRVSVVTEPRKRRSVNKKFSGER